MKNLFDIAPLLPSIQERALLLTPNRRLAAKALSAYGEYRKSRQQRAWLTPRIQSLESWVQTSWEAYQDLPDGPAAAQPAAVTLDNRQELALWEQVIANSNAQNQLLTPAGAAAQCQSAYRTLRLWQTSIDDEGYRVQQLDPDLFGYWVKAFEQQLHKHQWLTQYDLIEQLTDSYRQGSLAGEKQILLLDFQDPPPLHQQLLEQAGESLSHFSAPAINHSCGYLGCQDSEAEIELAAQWARQIMTLHRQHPEQALPRIGIVVPELNSLRTTVARYFRRIFESDYLLPAQPASAPAFNISIGESLADTAVIFHGLELINYAMQPLSLQQLTELLYSPFNGHAHEATDELVALEQRLRYRAQHEYSLNDIIYAAEQLISNRQTAPRAAQLQPDLLTGLEAGLEEGTASDTTCDTSDKALDKLLGTLKRMQALSPPRRQLPSGWAQWFYQYLDSTGWPGTRQCNSLEYQQLDQWFSLLRELNRFDDIYGPLPLSQAIGLLRKETQAAIFQPLIPDSPVQILGPLEAAGLQFSHLWVMGLSDNSWPAPPAPNPLLPVGFQRQHQMPHATPERELEFSRYLTNSYQQNAEITVFSHPQVKDEQPLRPSALISGYRHFALNELPIGIRQCYEPDEALRPSVRDAASLLEYCTTSQAPPVSAAERALLRGGSSLIKNQALCPFSGFAIHRLNARPLEQPSLGLSPADRGNALHQALELFWQQVETQQQLLALDNDTLGQQLSELSGRALQPYQRRSAKWMGPRFWQLEQRRMQQLLMQWMDVERSRPPFQVIATEQTLKTELAGMPLTLRIDRIDRLADASTLLIDYKTGTTHRRSWAGERPEEPQLPLYAIASRKDVSALAFAEVNAHNQHFNGFADDRDHEAALQIEGIDGIGTQRTDLPADWPQTLDYWQHNLNTLVKAFVSGQCSVDPIANQADKAYAYSGLEPLNRIYEFEQLATDLVATAVNAEGDKL